MKKSKILAVAAITLSMSTVGARDGFALIYNPNRYCTQLITAIADAEAACNVEAHYPHKHAKVYAYYRVNYEGVYKLFICHEHGELELPENVQINANGEIYCLPQ